MANNLSVTIGANTADLEKNINKAKQTLQEYRAAAKQAKNAIESNVGATTKQVNAYDNVVKKLEKVTSGTLSCKQEQKVLTDAVKELKIQWNTLTDDQRISGWGQQVASSLKAAESELESVKGKLAAVSDETKKTTKGIDTVGTSSSKTGNVLGSLNGVLGKVGLAFGAAEAATTLFNGALKQSDEFGDLVTNKMAGLTNVVYQLGAALATLDFSGVMNFYSWFSSGQAASQAQDNLDDTDQQVQYLLKQAQEAIAKAKESGLDSDKNIANQKIKELQSYARRLTNDAANAAAADVGKALGSSKLNGIITTEIIDKAIKATPAQRQKAINNFKQVYAELQGKAISASGEARWGPKSDALLRRYAQQGGLLTIVTGALWGTGSENRQKIIDELNKASDASRIVSRLYKQLNGTPDIKTPKVSTATATEEKTILQTLEEQNKKKAEELSYRQKNYEMLNEQVVKERELTEELKKQKELEKIDWNEVKKLKDANVKPVSLLDTGKTTKSIEELSKEVSKTLQPELDKIPENYRKQQKAAEESMKQQMGGVQSLASGISGLGQAIGGTTGQIISSMGQVMSMFPGMIDAIQKLTLAKQAEGIASATAEGSKAPWFMQVAVIAGLVANVMATFASIPKFADGGIFNGASKFGDYNIARVNDGEMILNGRQQANLFRMLDSGNINTSTIAVQNPEVRIKGADIYLSQKNYKNITGRKL